MEGRLPAIATFIETYMAEEYSLCFDTVNDYL